MSLIPGIPDFYVTILDDTDKLQSSIALLRYNNYFDRMHRRKFDTIEQWQQYFHDSSYNPPYPFTGYIGFTTKTDNSVNFNHGDGVNTSVILGRDQLTKTYPLNPSQEYHYADDYDQKIQNPLSYDYLVEYKLVAVEYEDYSDPDNPKTVQTTVKMVVSCWFIMGAQEIRQGQYKYTLRRDVISEYFDMNWAQESNPDLDMTYYSLPALIKKGYVDDTNPLILNQESITVNQIKKEEILLKDESETAWIVGYMSKDTGVADSFDVQAVAETFSDYVTLEDLATELNLAPEDLSSILMPRDESTPTLFLDNNVEIVAWINDPNNNSYEWKMHTGSYNNLQSFTRAFEPTSVSHNPTSDCFAKISKYYKPDGAPWMQAMNENISIIRNNWETFTGHPLFKKEVYNRLHSMSKYNNKSILYINGTYYYICEKNTTPQGGNRYEFSKNSGGFNTICNSYITKQNALNPYANVVALTGGKIFLYANEISTVFYLEKITDTSVIPGASLVMSSTRNALVSEPYDMFAMPFNSVKAITNTTYDLVGDYSLKLAMEMAKKLDKNLYDIQLLPYCPFQDANTGTILRDNTIDLSTLREGYDYNWITEDGATLNRNVEASPETPISSGTITTNVVLSTNIDNTTVTNVTYQVVRGVLTQGEPLTITHSADSNGYAVITTSNFEYVYDAEDPDTIPVIQFTITFTQQDYPVSIVLYPKSNSSSFTIDHKIQMKDSKKIELICNQYRLCSPNYQGSFDFNVAKNGGIVNGFVVNFTYKPYTPYIRVAPIFDGLYGGEYQDCRGLNCGGDFSIGFVNSSWENYQLNNKNYQNIFNREIQNLDVQQSIQRIQQPWALTAGAVASTTQGAATGVMATGSPWGALIGLGTGGASLAGGLADLNLMEKQLIEQRQYAIDKYQLQLGNVQALPYTLTKVGAFTVTSKFWPFVEYYTCTDEEKETLEYKFHYEGYNLNIVSNVFNYIDYKNGSYIQADLIRSVNHRLNEDLEDVNTDILGNTSIVEAVYLEFSKGLYWCGETNYELYK